VSTNIEQLQANIKREQQKHNEQSRNYQALEATISLLSTKRMALLQHTTKLEVFTCDSF
jgi:hypothetical protein